MLVLIVIGVIALVAKRGDPSAPLARHGGPEKRVATSRNVERERDDCRHASRIATAATIGIDAGANKSVRQVLRRDKSFLAGDFPGVQLKPALVRLSRAVHTAFFAPTGIGKGVSCVIPRLRNCRDIWSVPISKVNLRF